MYAMNKVLFYLVLLGICGICKAETPLFNRISSSSLSRFSTIQDTGKTTQPITRFADKAAFGFGIGMDHGGLGINISVYPHKNFGLFGGVGYAFAGTGLNGGVKLRMIPKEKFIGTSPFLFGMYGYNAALVVEKRSDLSKLFYGFTLGIGIDIRTRKNKGYFSLAGLLPFRSDEVNKYKGHLYDVYGVTFERDLIPFGISFGYKRILK